MPPCPDNSIEKSIVMMVRGNIVYLSGGKMLKKDYTFYSPTTGLCFTHKWRKKIKTKTKSPASKAKQYST